MVAVAAVVAGVATAPAGAQLSAAGADEAVSSAGCAHRANDTPRKLLPCIRTEDLWRHMRAFQAIADAHPGPDGHPSRNSGEPGYKAAVDLAVKLFKASGYHVTVQTYKFPYFAFFGLPGGSEVSPTPTTFTLGTKAPRIDKVRTFPETADDIVMMDWGLSFTPNDVSDLTPRQAATKVNPKIVLSIRLGKGFATASMPIL